MIKLFQDVKRILKTHSEYIKKKKKRKEKKKKDER
jgi:hypothetical protein